MCRLLWTWTGSGPLGQTTSPVVMEGPGGAVDSNTPEPEAPCVPFVEGGKQVPKTWFMRIQELPA